MIHAKPIFLTENRRGIARLYGGEIVIIWDGGIATKSGTQAEFDALPDKLSSSDLRGYAIEER